MALIRLLYRSDSELSGSDRAVRETAFAIAEAASARNIVEGVSSALLFIGGVFVQVLEGESAAVEAAFERICCDFRHRRIVLLDFSEVPERSFALGMIAFEGDERARALFPAVTEAVSFTHRMSASMVVDLMRSLLTRRTARAGERTGERLIATDVME